MRLSFKVLFFLLFTFQQFVLCQPFVNEILWTNPTQPLKNGYIEDVEMLTTNEQYLYYYVKSWRPQTVGAGTIYTYFLGKYNKETNQVSYLEISPSLNTNKLSYLNHVFFDSKVQVFSYFHNKTKMKLYIFCQEYDLNSFKAEDNISKIAEIDMSDKGSTPEAMIFEKYKDKYIFRYSCKTLKGNFYGMEVFNQNLNSLWKTYQLDRSVSGYLVESNYVIDKSGNVFAIIRNYKTKYDADWCKYDKSDLRVVRYSNDGSSPLSVGLNLENDSYTIAAKLEFGKKNELICAGLYSDKSRNTVTGSYSFLIDDKCNVISGKSNPISEELVNEGLKEKSENKYVRKFFKKKKNEEKFSYTMKDFHFFNDGGYDIIAEKYYGYIVYSGNGGGIYNNFDDLWIMRFNADNTLKWIKKLPKYAQVMNQYFDLGTYYSFYNSDNNLNIVYNLAYSIQSLTVKVVSSTYLMTYNENGNGTKKLLCSDQKISKKIAPAYSIYNSENLILTQFEGFKNYFIPSMKSNSFRFGFVNIGSLK